MKLLALLVLIHAVYPTSAGGTQSILACPAGEEISPQEVNSLIFRVDVHTTSRANVFAEYQPKDKNRPLLRSAPSKTSNSHTLYMVRLYQETEYDFFVYNGVGVDCIAKGTFKTGTVPEDIVGSKGRNPTLLDDGQCSGNRFVVGAITREDLWYAYDNQGEIVWWLEHEGLETSGAFLINEVHNIVVQFREDDKGGSLLEFTPYGRDVGRLETECQILHHGLTEDSKGKFYAVGKARHHVPDLGIDVASDTVVEVDPKGGSKVLVDLINYVDPEYERSKTFDYLTEPGDLFGCDPDDQGDDVEDYIHINGLHIRDDLIVLSSRNLDCLYGLDYIKRKWNFAWKLCSNDFSDFEFSDNKDRFYGNHGPFITPCQEGVTCQEQMTELDILLFDNGSSRPADEGGEYSRGLMLHLDTEKKEVSASWEFQYLQADGTLCFGSHRGKTLMLDNGNVIVFFPSCGENNKGGDNYAYVAEVDESEQLVCIFREDPARSFLVDFAIVDSIFGEQEIGGNMPKYSVRSDADEDFTGKSLSNELGDEDISCGCESIDNNNAAMSQACGTKSGDDCTKSENCRWGCIAIAGISLRVVGSVVGISSLTIAIVVVFMLRKRKQRNYNRVDTFHNDGAAEQI